MKLHLNLAGQAACGRQLSNHRDTRSQLQDTIILAQGYEQFSQALNPVFPAKPNACRFCARTVGLLPPAARAARGPSIQELYDALTEDEDFTDAVRENGSDDDGSGLRVTEKPRP